MKNVEIDCAGSVQSLVKTCSNANLDPAPIFLLGSQLETLSLYEKC